MADKSQSLTVLDTEMFQMIACRPEYGRASNGLPYSLVIHDKITGGHDANNFIHMVRVVAGADKDLGAAAVVAKAAAIVEEMNKMAIAKGWFVPVPGHHSIENAFGVTEKLKGGE